MVGLGGVALALRLWGIGFGLPALYGPAEHVLVNNALALGTGNPIPLTFQYQPLFSFVLFGGFGVLYLLGVFLGLYQGASEFAVSYLTDPSAVYLTGRGLEALVGAATVVLTYRLGERLFSRKVGVLSGLALAFLPLHAEYSHYTRPDVPTVFFVVLVLISVVSFLDSGRIRHLALAGLWVGLGGLVGQGRAAAVEAEGDRSGGCGPGSLRCWPADRVPLSIVRIRRRHS